jgi:energy-coupling factor transporter ATP-binding protein EcfA2
METKKMMNADILVTDRATQIAKIINQRQGMIKDIEPVEENLKNLILAMRKLEDKRQKIIPQVRESGVPSSLETIEFSASILALKSEYDKLKNLKTRFSNSTLNIGVVGRMGQGKSTLLQSLTGLPDDIIPARQGKACTAARSTIYHRPEGEIEARVAFHTEESFLEEIILPYFEKLNLNPKPSTINDFENLSLTSSININADRATDTTIYERLYKDYYLGLGSYRKLLDRLPETVKREKIQKYVSQNRDEQNNLIDYEHLAVRHVEIFCGFPKADIGRIALVDVPGLGDFKLGDEKLMLETLGKEVDVVLFVSKPGNDRYGWETQDTDLYDNAATALNDLADRAFMVLNLHDSGQNLRGCESQKADVDNRSVRMGLAKPCIIANCASDNANNEVLEPVLKYLETEITELDKKYASSCQKRLIKLHKQIKHELKKASEVMQQFANEKKKFREHFTGKNGDSGLWKEIQNGLGKLLDRLRQERETEDTEFKKRVEETLTKCKSDTGILSVQEIESQRYAPGREAALYLRYLEEVRAHLSRHFLSLDGDLQQSLEAVKSEVKKVLAEEGKLKNLSDTEGSTFFMEIATELPDLSESNLRLGFKTLGEFNLSFSGKIQRLIRPHLEVIVPKINTTLTSLEETVTSEAQKIHNQSEAQKIHNQLKHIHAQVINACEKELMKLSSEPNQIAYYMVEDFLDRVLYARGVQNEWDDFIWENRQKVWSEFKLLGERVQVKQEWDSLVNQAEKANELYRLRFLN